MAIRDIPDWATAIKISKEEVLCGNNPETFDEACNVLGNALIELLISKNRKYGKGNILGSERFGINPMQSLMIR